MVSVSGVPLHWLTDFWGITRCKMVLIYLYTSKWYTCVAGCIQNIDTCIIILAAHEMKVSVEKAWRKKEKGERKGRGRSLENKKDTEQRLGFGLLNIKIHWLLKPRSVSMPQWLGASASKTRIGEQCRDKSCLGAEGDAFVLFCLGMSGNVTLCKEDPITPLCYCSSL